MNSPKLTKIKIIPFLICLVIGLPHCTKKESTEKLPEGKEEKKEEKKEKTKSGFTTLPGLTEAVNSVSFSPDSKVLAALTEGSVSLIEIATGRQVTRIDVCKEATEVAFSPNGKMLAIGCNAPKSDLMEATVKLWDIAAGREVMSLKPNIAYISSLAFSPDNKILAVSYKDRVTLFDAATGKEAKLIKFKKEIFPNIAFSPDGKRLAIGGYDDKKQLGAMVRIWDPITGKQIASFIEDSSIIHSIAYSPDGKRLAIGNWTNTVKLIEAATGKEIFTFEPGIGSIYSLAFSPDGQRLAVGGIAGRVALYDPSSANLIAELIKNKETATTSRSASVAISPDGTYLATINKNGLKLWKLADIR